jgi:hypothetical protein
VLRPIWDVGTSLAGTLLFTVSEALRKETFVSGTCLPVTLSRTGQHVLLKAIKFPLDQDENVHVVIYPARMRRHWRNVEELHNMCLNVASSRTQVSINYNYL